MMLKISVEPGAAFDILSILSVKAAMKGILDQSIDELSKQGEFLIKEIDDQISHERTVEICESEEFKKLTEINALIFLKIDACHNGSDITAQEMDKLNYQRFLAKSELQKKFFNEDIKEIKIGY